MLAAPAQAAPWTPPKPKTGHARIQLVDVGCKLTADGIYRSYAIVDTHVYKLKTRYGLFRQKIKVQIDKQVGFSDSRPDWRQVDSVTDTKGDAGWFQKDVAYGSPGGLPDSARTSLRTGIQPDFADFTAKVTVWLKRQGLPKATWRYRARSKPFNCRTDQLPIANGGSPGGG